MMKNPNRLPISLWGAAALLLAIAFARPAHAADPQTPLVLEEVQSIQVQGPRQVFRDDLTVEGGQTIEGDVFVYSGDVDVEGGGRITGNLLVFSGDIEMDEESTVDGNVTAYNGDVYIAGHIGGDLANLSGDIELAATAQVDGDLSVVSGDIDRDAASSVGGNVVQGPSFRFPGAPDAPSAPSGVSFQPQGTSFFGKILNFIGRLVLAALLTAFTMLLVGGLFYMRPQLIADTRTYLNKQFALSVVVGAIANLILLFLAGLLAITICLLPLALVPMLGLLAVNVVGWAVASQIAGERIVAMSKQSVQPSLTILVGAFVLTGICALLWAIGGCFRPLAFLLIFAVSSAGAGAVLVPWLNRRRGASGAGSEGGGDVPPSGPPPSGPVPSAADAPVETDVAAPIDYVTASEINAGTSGSPATASAQRSAAQPRVASFATGDSGETVDLDVAAPIDYVTAEEINTMAEQPAKPRTRGKQSAPASTTGGVPPTEGDVVEEDVAAPIDYVTAEEINTTAEQPPAQPAKPRTRSTKQATSETLSRSVPSTEEEIVEQDVAGPIDYVTAQEVVTTEVVTEGDDFLRIKGIGPTYARRLKDAGYATFAQLGAASVDEVASAIGWPVDRVRKAEVIDQAQMLAQRG